MATDRVFFSVIGAKRIIRTDGISRKRSHIKDSLFALIVLLLAASCHPFNPEIRKSPAGELPRTFSLYNTERTQERWWEEFEDSELNALVEEALSGSLSLKEAWARLDQVRALAVQAGSALYPDLSVASGASGSRRRTENGSAETNTLRDYSLGVVSSYELDLWGRVRSKREAAALEVGASREDVNAGAMTLAAEVTERWARIISQRMQKRLLERQLETNLTYLELVELRFLKSMVSALDVYQQKQIVERVKAEIPLVEAQEQLLLHELALLLGKPPRAALQISSETLPSLNEIPATGLPADLLAARPDVRSAGLRLQEADWRVAVARADRLPAISLSANAGYGAAHLDMLFNNWILKLAGTLSAPVFDSGARKAEVGRTRAVVDERLAKYRETVLTAIKEVEDALVSESKQREHIKALELQAEAARKALEQAVLRYRKGIASYLPVLTQLLTVQDLERDLIQRHTELVIDRVSLYRALGGTWTQALRPDEGSDEAGTRGDVKNEG